MTDVFTSINQLDGRGEVSSNVVELGRLFPDAVVDGAVDFNVLRDLLGGDSGPSDAEGFGLRWPGMADARRLSALPATMTLLPEPDESVDWDETRNIVIEGDNLEVLRLLRRGYTNSVDVIYIDPPYNTGNDFVYDDKRVATQSEHEAEAGFRDEDGVLQTGPGSDRSAERKSGASRHSKWLSMMYPRLLVAQNLLKETGVIIVAIDDVEHARLKLLLDRVFGAENFAANIVWQGVGKNDARFTSGGNDYMLIYAKSLAGLVSRDARWVEPKKGYDLVLNAAQRSWEDAGGLAGRATELFKKWWRSNPDVEKGLQAYSEIDGEGRAFRRSPVSSPNRRENLIYDLLHPESGLPVVAPANGWRYARETMDAKIAEGKILFGRDHSYTISSKVYLDEAVDQAIRPTFFQVRARASDALEQLLGSQVFPFPKDSDVLRKWINAVSESDSRAFVLDFFAGSGSTGQAVLELNASDSGTRRHCLIQIDEVVGRDGYQTIADITRERLRRAGKQISDNRDPAAPRIDTGFRSYRLASSNVKPWDGTGDLDLLAAADNLAEGRTTDDLLVEMMLRLGIDLVTPVATQQVAGSTLYSLAGTLYAFFGTGVTVEVADEIARAIVSWRDAEPVDSEVTVVVRDTGFEDSSAKLNLAAALQQAGIKTLRSI